MINKLQIILALTTALLVGGCGEESASGQKAKDSGNQPSLDLNNYTKVSLTNDQTYALAYMWHEEKLAYDIYMEMNKVHPAKQFENIATKSEIKHIALVQDLVAWYDVNITNLADYTVNYSQIELDTMPTGEFAVPEVQKLYDDLYAKGKSSLQDALEVACMVEVVDVNDLDKFIAASAGNDALIDTFNILRDGSYSHYWAFDKGLVNLGVTDGCCSLGTEYCHKEYPENSKGEN